MSRLTATNHFENHVLPSYDSEGYAKEILEAGKRQLELALQENYGRVIVFHLNFNFPQSIHVDGDTPNNCFQYFIENFRRWKLMQKDNCRYIWVREVGEINSKLHYHLLLLLDGRKIKFMTLERITILQRYWGNALMKHFGFYCLENQVPVHVGSSLYIDSRNLSTIEAYIQGPLAYLAKIHTKELCGRNIRTWSQSVG